MKKYNMKMFLLVPITLFVLCRYINHAVPPVQLPVHIKNHSHFNVRIYCFILTTPKYFATRARAVNSTWAKRCDRYTFISEYSKNTKGLPIAPLANLTPGY